MADKLPALNGDDPQKRQGVAEAVLNQAWLLQSRVRELRGLLRDGGLDLDHYLPDPPRTTTPPFGVKK